MTPFEKPSVRQVAPPRQVVLVGAGDLGADALSVHEALVAARTSGTVAGGAVGGVVEPAALPSPHLAGYLDDDPALQGRTVHGFPVLGPVAWLEDRADQFAALVTVGDPAVRADLRRRLQGFGATLATWVHPSAVRTRSVSFGDGCLVMGATSFTVDVEVGRNVVVNPGAAVAHHARIGDDAVLCPGVQIAGRVAVGPRAFLGTGAVVTPGCTIGADALVGAGAVAVADVAAGARVAGVPAQPI